ncbi:hypothetical protein V2J09_015660 [Rumex salicifolius]
MPVNGLIVQRNLSLGDTERQLELPATKSIVEEEVVGASQNQGQKEVSLARKGGDKLQEVEEKNNNPLIYPQNDKNSSHTKAKGQRDALGKAKGKEVYEKTFNAMVREGYQIKVGKPNENAIDNGGLAKKAKALEVSTLSIPESSVLPPNNVLVDDNNEIPRGIEVEEDELESTEEELFVSNDQNPPLHDKFWQNDPEAQPSQDDDIAEEACSYANFSNFARVEAIRFTRGVWLLWQAERVDVVVIHKGDNLIHATISIGNKIHYLLAGPLLVGGDFNCIIHNFERQGGSGGLHADSKVFLDLVNKLGLIDLGFMGMKFTWNRGSDSDNRVAKRLDRVFPNFEARLFWPNAVVKNLVNFSSDQVPVLFCGEPNLQLDRTKRLFHFEAMWLKNENFSAFLKDKIRNQISHQLRVSFKRKFGARMSFQRDGGEATSSLLTQGFPTVPPEDLQALTKPISQDEIWSVVKSMKGVKLPGLDGYHPIFFKECWQVMGESVTKFVQQFSQSVTLPKTVELAVCQICLSEEETYEHLFRDCATVKTFWEQWLHAFFDRGTSSPMRYGGHGSGGTGRSSTTSFGREIVRTSSWKSPNSTGRPLLSSWIHQEGWRRRLS